MRPTATRPAGSASDAKLESVRTSEKVQPSFALTPRGSSGNRARTGSFRPFDPPSHTCRAELWARQEIAEIFGL
jgi:hypothetical protein